MRKLSRPALSVLVLLAAALLTGCGKKTLSKSQTYPVRGKIKYQGEPARYVLVFFHPQGGKGAEAKARTDDDGNYDLRTYSNTEENDGAVPGEYTVTIQTFDPVRGGRLPEGAKPTQVAGGEAKAPDTYEIKDEATDSLNIDIP